MSAKALFIKNGLVVRASDTNFTPQKGEKRFVIDKTKAESVYLQSGDTKLPLLTYTIGYPFREIPSDTFLTEYDTPVITRAQKKTESLLKVILEALGTTLSGDIKETLSLLQESLTSKASFEEYWGRLVYTEGEVTLTDGDGFTAEVVQDGEIKLTFEEAFSSETTLSVFASFETDGVRYLTANGSGGTDCTLYLKALSDGSAVTEATFSVLVKGRL